MGRPVDGVVPHLATGDQLVQAGDIVRHVAVGRRDDGGRPAHDMVAAEQRILLLEVKAQMVRGVARCKDGLDGPAVALDHVAVFRHDIRHEALVAAGFDHGAGLDPAAAVRAEAVGRRRPFALQRRGGRRMVPMRMGDQDMGDRLAAQGMLQGVDMGGKQRTGIDNGDLAAPDDIGAGAVEGERPAVRRDHPADRRRDRFDPAVFEIQFPVEGDAVRHLLLSGLPLVERHTNGGAAPGQRFANCDPAFLPPNRASRCPRSRSRPYAAGRHS